MLMQAIEIQFREMKELAENMNAVAKELEYMGEQRITEQIGRTKPLWLSESADLFIGKEVKTGVEITAIAVSLRRAASIVEKQAQLMYLAEKGNELIAKQRTY